MLGQRLCFDEGAAVNDQVAAFVEQLVGMADLSTGQAYWLRLAADEITTNILQHGYRGGAGRVDLYGSVEADRVWLRIEDEAPEFDPRCHDPGPHLATAPAERPEGGHGLLLALTKLNDFDYDYTDGRNRNTLIMWRPSPLRRSAETENSHDVRDACAHRRRVR
ncbi:ATP-binding protein [Allonocardiopsis opalescens]|uniref:Serine/threonine-protein kinase RsbW n=1 Tax=Allonocardiopsis opalescens TaxID=1144618 RepID=A0A2T0PZY8_9ACTN|nr:ATP-binding protein [Allonocardiopsis opalescens]PRX97098.1 serine/threonine-protein kinase RsbW [Allonocardiopsis opalescens]